MDLSTLLANRRMTRSFRTEPVDVTMLAALCAEALRAPTAGNSAGVRCTVIGHDDTAAFFEVATDPEWRASAPRAPGLLRAGAVVLVTCRPQDYFDRYREPDKAASGLGTREAWPVPYWHTDAAMATMALLLLVEEAGLGATIWGSFRHVPELLTWVGAEDEDLFASVLIGYPDGEDHRSPSLNRVVPTRAQRVRVWGASTVDEA